MNVYLKGQKPRRKKYDSAFPGCSALSFLFSHKEHWWPRASFLLPFRGSLSLWLDTHLLLSVFYLCEISPCTLPLLPAKAHGRKAFFPALDQAEQRRWTAHRRMTTQRSTARPASTLSALRPDMKGLFREIQGIVIRAFLLLIMVLPESEEKKTCWCAIYYNTWVAGYI